MSETKDSRETTGVMPGDRFRQMLPYGRGTVEVISIIDADHVGVLRPNGARQVFPVSTLLTPRYWQQVAP